ncbi:MAG TPA: cell division protein FtsA, partial [Treponemataceae bacterium]|nr:cell division protein FtsA [Treponemataceae bacterium]
MSEVVVGLDIGTSRIRALIGEISDTGVFQITGVGTSPSTGLRKGVVVNIENTVRAIAQAVEAAEMMSGIEVTRCMIGIGGTHIDGLNSRGVVAVTGKGRDNREIGQEDINRVIDAAKAVVIPMDRQVLHVIPQSYIVDEQKGVRDPRNMIGVRLEAEVHIITGSVTSVQNMVKCVNRASLSVDEYMMHSLAAVKSVMTQDERELGSILIDLGGGTTDVLVMADGAPLLT